jgi:YHS domain-containing protein
MELFEVKPTVRPGIDKLVDPVCRMELTRSEVEARLTIDGIEHVFCSTSCLQLFVATPDRYP